MGNPLVSELQEDFEPDEITSHSSKPNIVQKNRIKLDVPQRRPASDGSSEEKPDDTDMKQTNDEFDSTINSEISELTSEAFDTWMGADSKWRRSPEGGEDVSVLSQTFDYSAATVYDDTTSVTSSNVPMELLSSKHSQGSINNSDNEEGRVANKKEKKKEKGDKKGKHKKDKEKKESGKREKKQKRRSHDETSSHRDELEEFLNGSVSPPIDAAYEAI